MHGESPSFSSYLAALPFAQHLLEPLCETRTISVQRCGQINRQFTALLHQWATAGHSPLRPVEDYAPVVMILIHGYVVQHTTGVAGHPAYGSLIGQHPPGTRRSPELPQRGAGTVGLSGD